MADKSNPSAYDAAEKKKRRRGRKQQQPVTNGKSHPRPTREDPHRRHDSGKDGANSASNNNSVLIQLRNPQDGSQIRWYEYGKNLTGRNATIVTHPPPRTNKKGGGAAGGSPATATNARPALVGGGLCERYRVRADEVYRGQVQRVSSQKSSADDRWVESTLHKGTLKDRIAAMSVIVSNDPVHKLYALDSLLQLAGCSISTTSTSPADNGRKWDNNSISNSGNNSNNNGKSTNTNSRVAQMAAEALEDLFLNALLPPDRKLLTLAQRPLYLYDNSSIGDSTGAATTTSSTTTSSTTLSPRLLLLWRYEELIRQKFESFVQQYYVRTLRDGMESDKIFCLRSSASLLRSVPEGEAALLQLLVDKIGDPNKKVAAASGHQLRVVLYKHPAMRIVVAREVQQLAHRSNLSHRALYNCICFLNQLKLTKDDAEEEGDTKGAGTSLAASLISTYFRLFEVAVANKKNTDNNNNKKKRSKRDSEDDEAAAAEAAAMKSRLLSALLTGVNRAHPYLPARHRSLDQHVDALYRVVHTAAPSTSTQALLLLFHTVVTTVVDVNDKHGNQDGDDEDDEEDEDTGGRNILDVPATPEQEKKRERFFRALYSTLSNPSMLGAGKHLTLFFNLLYKALKYDTDDTRVVAFAKRIMSTALHCGPSVTASSLFLLHVVSKYHPVLRTCGCDILRGLDAVRVLDYSKREPRGALVVAPSSPKKGDVNKDGLSNNNGKAAPLWELALTRHHFHPSVAKFTTLFGDEITYTGDPLKDFALAPFLDKFAFRNPKSSERLAQQQQQRGSSVAARRAKPNTPTAPVNDPNFWEQRSEVDAQDEFFQRFFMERAKRDKLKGIVRNVAKDLDENEEEEEEDGALDAAEADYVGKKFEDLEDQWETDSEEEAFVDSLAQKIIEDSIDANGPGDLDDEDPDMEGWNDDDDDEDDVADAAEAEVEGEEEDAFMDDDDDSDDSDDGDSEDGEPEFEGEDRIASFAEADFQDHDEDDESDAGSDDDDDDDLALLEADDDDDDYDGPDSDGDADDDGEAQVGSSQWKERKKMLKAAMKTASTFASLEEYEDQINESFNTLKLKRPRADNNPGAELEPAERGGPMDDESPSSHKEKSGSGKKKGKIKKRRKTAD